MAIELLIFVALFILCLLSWQHYLLYQNAIGILAFQGGRRLDLVNGFSPCWLLVSCRGGRLSVELLLVGDCCMENALHLISLFKCNSLV